MLEKTPTKRGVGEDHEGSILKGKCAKEMSICRTV